MSGRRPAPGPDPSLAAWGTVFLALVRVMFELAEQGIRLIGFIFTRRRWRREVEARVRRNALAAHSDDTSSGGFSPGRELTP